MPFLQELYREWPFFRTLLSNMDMVLAKSSIAIASRYAELVPDAELREKIFGRIRREWHLSIETLLDIMGQERLLQGNPLLERSVRHRFPYLDPLNHVQVELLKEHRAQNPDEQIAVLGVAAHTVLVGIAPAHRAPDAALGVAADPVGDAGFWHIGKHLAVGRLASSDIEVEHANMRGIVGPVSEAGVADIELLL